MITRFIHPKIDMFFENRGMKESLQLAIASETDDGSCWFGIRDAIENYCEEYGCDLSKVRWLVKVRPDDRDYTEIVATDIDDWIHKFNELDVVYEEIPERW